MKRDKQQHKYSFVIASPIGKLGIALINGRIAKISFLPPKTSLIFPKGVAARRIVAKIKQYFYNSNSQLRFLMARQGTFLQNKIWRALQKIPVGKTVTYGELAKKLQTGPRVIGNACRLNPLPIIIPCHRVVAANGLGGYCGKKADAIKIKKWLLAHENKYSSF